MAKEKLIKSVTDRQFQRNGVCGRPFYSVTFVNADPMVTLIAVIPSDAKPGECFVIDPADGDSHWRGDKFQSEVQAVIDAWNRERFPGGM